MLEILYIEEQEFVGAADTSDVVPVKTPVQRDDERFVGSQFAEKLVPISGIDVDIVVMRADCQL